MPVCCVCRCGSQVFDVGPGLAGLVRESFWDVSGANGGVNLASVRLRSATLRMPHSGKEAHVRDTSPCLCLCNGWCLLFGTNLVQIITLFARVKVLLPQS